MKNKKNLFTAAIIVLAAIAVIFALKDTLADQSTKKEVVEDFSTDPVGKKAPDFTLNDLDGNEVRLSDYKGKKVLINFWATWCPPCQKEMPALQSFHEENIDVAILAINIDPAQDVRGFMNEYKLTFPALLDEGTKVASKYGTFQYPETYFVDENGVVQKKWVGEMTTKTLKAIMATM